LKLIWATIGKPGSLRRTAPAELHEILGLSHNVSSTRSAQLKPLIRKFLRQQESFMWIAFARRLVRDRSGNVAIIFALSIVPCIFLTGMALDYTAATQKRVILNAAADAAALAAVTPTMMGQSTTVAQTAATNIFNATASTAAAVTGITPTVTVTNSLLTRTSTVSYTAQSTNSFPNVLKLLTGASQNSWPISGSSQATSSASPNINFYLLLDNSPSMDIAATTAGISTMLSATANAPASGQNAGGCAFACHESNPSSDNLGNPNGEDNYALAANLGVVTRIQNMAAATQALMTTATTTEAANNAIYQMAIYTFNGSGIYQVQALTSSLTSAATAAATIDVLEVYNNNCLTQSNCNNDTDTNFDAAMSQTTALPNPGTGASTSTPQEVLFIVSDGVEDDNTGTCSQPLSGTRCQAPFDTTWCTTVKNRGIRIAVLYTSYLPLTTNAWYNSWVAPFQSQIATNMQSCASSGLYFSITTNGDISSAMQALFEQAVATARLAQ
jgi:Flp pilus assembly protein TadG